MKTKLKKFVPSKRKLPPVKEDGSPVWATTENGGLRYCPCCHRPVSNQEVKYRHKCSECGEILF